jgi:hypothetical protein
MESCNENYEQRVENKILEWNSRIDELSAASLNVSDDVKMRYNDEIAELVANRESLRRGLVKLEDNDTLCVACSEEPQIDEEPVSPETDVVDDFLYSDMNVTANPKSRYGPEE